MTLLSQLTNSSFEGQSGFSGYSGYSGLGLSGYSGQQGTSGYSGMSGYSGAASVDPVAMALVFGGGNPPEFQLEYDSTAKVPFYQTDDATRQVGYLNLPQNIKFTDYTLVITDAGKHILHISDDTTDRTFTIPANSSVSFPIGTQVTFINQANAGVVTIAIGGSDIIRLSPTGSTGNRTLAANGIASAIKITSTEWMISGSGLT